VVQLGGTAHASQNHPRCAYSSDSSRRGGSERPSRYGICLRPVEILRALLFPAERLLFGLCSFASRLLAQVRGSQPTGPGTSFTAGLPSSDACDQEGWAHGGARSTGSSQAGLVRAAADYSSGASRRRPNGQAGRNITSHDPDQPYATLPPAQLTMTPVHVQGSKNRGGPSCKKDLPEPLPKNFHHFSESSFLCWEMRIPRSEGVSWKRLGGLFFTARRFPQAYLFELEPV